MCQNARHAGNACCRNAPLTAAPRATAATRSDRMSCRADQPRAPAVRRGTWPAPSVRRRAHTRHTRTTSPDAPPQHTHAPDIQVALHAVHVRDSEASGRGHWTQDRRLFDLRQATTRVRASSAPPAARRPRTRTSRSTAAISSNVPSGTTTSLFERNTASNRGSSCARAPLIHTIHAQMPPCRAAPACLEKLIHPIHVVRHTPRLRVDLRGVPERPRLIACESNGARGGGGSETHLGTTAPAEAPTRLVFTSIVNDNDLWPAERH